MLVVTILKYRVQIIRREFPDKLKKYIFKMIMLCDKIQVMFHLKLRAKLLHRAPVGAPPSFSPHKNLWSEISIILALGTIGRKLDRPRPSASHAPAAIRLKLLWHNYGHKHCT